MAKSQSAFVPQHQYWYEDLPARNAPYDRAPKMVHGDINAMDEACLEVSRASTLMRGVGVFFVLFAVGFYLFLAYISRYFFPLNLELVVPLLLIFFLNVGMAGLTIYLAKFDLSVSRDRPVRFNRAHGEVYVYEHAYTWNPFVKWPTTVKIFDWDTLGAELHRQAGYNGKIYMVRYSLWLVSCKPGTHEVVDRFELKGNIPTTEELYNAWAYCRQYMEHGPQDLPVYPPRRQGITFRRSLFEYLRFLDPTEEGREVRQRMTASDWAFNVPFIALTFWAFIPIGICHYIAMRFAPEAKWPVEIDAESRSV